MSEKHSHKHAQDRLNESLSAVMDGEAGEFELRRVLDRFGTEDEVRDKARRYQLAGDTIRHEANDFMDIDLTASIRDQLDREDAEVDTTLMHSSVTSSVISVSEQWWSRIGRVAVAASVAFALVFSVRNYNAVPDVDTFVDASTETTISQPIQIAQNGYGAASIQAGYSSKQHDSISAEQLAEAKNIASRVTRERFRAYALQHAQMSSVHSGQGVLPFARLTTFE